MSEIHLVPMNRPGSDIDFSENDEVRGLPFGTEEGDWKSLSPQQIEILKKKGSTADNWENILVLEGFNPHLVADCRFYGKIRIANLSGSFLEFHDLRLPVGLYKSTFISCDIGNDCAIHNVNYMASMIVGERCLLFNINELITTDHAKFGNGVIVEGEDENVRIWLEIANENGGRKVLPFDGMLPADAWMWSKFRDDKILMERFVEMTGRVQDSRRGRYGRIGKETVIKDCRILKDVKIGENAYIKGCNKLKNLTINSDVLRPTQLGEGCELVNGIIGYGCHVFYGVKAVRFILNDHSNLKYGARLINSILGSNSTISCCEVLNSLIFGSHEQHHNSSFLCASTLKGQSNMASAATVGSNHNSRSSDGEIVAERGFWPGLSVSLKHNSRFASFCLIAKGAYPAELDVPLPFTLVSNNEKAGELLLMPGYWFRYNMYALARNAAKTAGRDRRSVKHQQLEFDWLAPDTVDQMRSAMKILEGWAEESAAVASGKYDSGRAMLEAEESPELFAGVSYPVENGKRPVRILHAGRAWKDYRRMIRYYAIRTLAEGTEGNGGKVINTGERPPEGAGLKESWENLGGQLILKTDLEKLKSLVRSGEIDSWESLHRAYRDIGDSYQTKKMAHARTVLAEDRVSLASFSRDFLDEALETAAFILEGIRESRRKDYVNHFRNITFDNEKERDAVVGSFDENDFILKAQNEFERIKRVLKNQAGFRDRD